MSTPGNQNPPAWCYLFPFAGLIPQCTVNTQGSPLPPPSDVITIPAITAGSDLINQAESNALSSLLQPLLQALPGIGIKIGLFMGALMLVIVGFWIVASNPGGAS